MPDRLPHRSRRVLRRLSFYFHRANDVRFPLLVTFCFFLLYPLWSVEAARFAPHLSQYWRTHWDVKDGLPHNSVLDIEQDETGYLWVSTASGLSRFDGVEFDLSLQEEYPFLAKMFIADIAFTGDGTMWLGIAEIEEGSGFPGLVRIRDGNLERMEESWLNRGVYKLLKDRFGVLWIATHQGLGRYEEGTLSKVRFGHGLADHTILALHESNDGSLWIGTHKNGLFRYCDGEWSHWDAGDGLSSNHIKAIGGGNDQYLWIGTSYGGVNRINLSNGQVEVFSTEDGLSHGDIAWIYEDRQGVIWISSTNGGLDRWKDGVWYFQPPHYDMFRHTVSRLMEDWEGNLWIGSIGGGLEKFRLGNWITFTTQEGLPDDGVRTVLEAADGVLWIGTEYGGITCYKERRFVSYDEKEGLSDPFVISLCETEDGTLWVGTRGGGLNRFKDGTFEHYGRANGILDDDIRALIQTADGSLWVGTRNAGAFEMRNEKVVRRLHTANGLNDNEVRTFYEDTKGRLWIGTQGGGITVLEGEETWHLNTSHGLSSNQTRVIDQDENGHYWIGLHSGGLVWYHEGDMKLFTGENGLLDKDILSFEWDGAGRLWLSSNAGLFYVLVNDLQAVLQGSASSVKSHDLSGGDTAHMGSSNGGSYPASCKDSNGILWFPSKRGLQRIDPSCLLTNQIAPPVVLQEFIVDNHEMRMEDGIRLAPSRGDIEFKFAALSYRDIEGICFQYKLEGVDERWVEAGSRRFAFYSKVNPGRYTFRVRACNGDGVWNEKGASLAFVLLPYFYQTWTFYGLCGAALLGALWFIHALRVRIQRKIFYLQQQAMLEKERSRISQDMHDELGANLSQISILGDLALQEYKRGQDISHRIESVTNACRVVTGSLAEIVWTTSPANDSLESLVNYLIKLGQSLFDRSSINFRLDIDEALPSLALSAEMRHNLLLIVKEAMNNALKYSRAKEVWLRVHTGNQVLRIVVEDNGCGFDRQKLDRKSLGGNGLRNMESRAQYIGADVRIESRPHQGTRVKVTKPLNKLG